MNKALPAIINLLLDGEKFQYYINDFTTEASDYKAMTSRPASPKHVLSSTDGINFEFRGTPNQANYYTAKVQSSASSSFVSFYLVESDTPGVYRNPYPIRLSTSDEQGSSWYTVKFKEEDTLTTTISTTEGETVASESIMLDKGEYASCGISIFFSDATKVRNEMDGLKWINAGYKEFSDYAGSTSNPDHIPMQDFIKNAGENTATNGEADFLHFTSHGEYDGRLIDDKSPYGLDIILRPTDINPDQNLNQDVEWVFINACNTMNHATSGRDDWMKILTGTTHPIHGLLGYDEPVSGDLSSTIASFFARLGSTSSPETYLNAFFNAMTDGLADEPCAMAAHEENINDTFKTLTQDSTGNKFRYYWYATSATGGILHEETIVKASDGTTIRSAVEIDSIPTPALQPIVMKQKDFSQTPQGYTSRLRNCGLTTLDRPNSRLAEVPQDEVSTLDQAAKELTQAFGELPHDAYGPATGTLSMQSFNWQNAAIPSGPQTVIARTVQYNHYINGIPVIGDILAATVSGNKVLKLRGNWHEAISVKTQAMGSTAKSSQLITASTALKYALSGLSDNAQSKSKSKDIRLEEAELCYYGLQDSGKVYKTYNPTWRFRFKENNKLKNIYIDAVSGGKRPEKEMTEAMRLIR